MPFKSEKQRRYLWANEPEIARDWSDKYGSRVKKQLGGILDIGYLSKSIGERVLLVSTFSHFIHIKFLRSLNTLSFCLHPTHPHTSKKHGKGQAESGSQISHSGIVTEIAENGESGWISLCNPSIRPD